MMLHDKKAATPAAKLTAIDLLLAAAAAAATPA
jgi:hypothetical protein